jgi:hypothetical protein
MDQAKDSFIELRADNAIFISYFLRALVLKIEDGGDLHSDTAMLGDVAVYIEQALREKLTEQDYAQLRLELKARIGGPTTVQ